MNDADQRDTVDLRHVALMGACRDRELLLTGKVEVLGIAEEESRCFLDNRCAVERLGRQDAFERAARDVARGVATAARRREPTGSELVQDLRQLRQGDEVQLHVLPCGQLRVPLAVRVRDIADRAEALRR